MQVKTANFITSSAKVDQCPPPDKPEYAFIGRSNVGKSSLINMLTQRKNLAKTSATPGKTQLINHFLINDAWYLVDLPGYGWARVSKTERSKWDKMIKAYFAKRENLCLTFVLLDSRLPPQEIDIKFINGLGEAGVPFGIIFTKGDKLSSNQLAKNIAAYEKALKRYWEVLPSIFASSSAKKIGREEILNYIDQINMQTR